MPEANPSRKKHRESTVWGKQRGRRNRGVETEAKQSETEEKQRGRNRAEQRKEQRGRRNRGGTEGSEQRGRVYTLDKMSQWVG